MNARKIEKLDAFMKMMTDEHLREHCTTEFSTLAIYKRKIKPLLRKWTKYLNDHGNIGRWEAIYCTACAKNEGKRSNLHVHILSEFWVNKEINKGN